MASTPSTACHNNAVSFTFLVCMAIFAVLVAAGGICYARLKHDLVEVRTKIDETQREINERKMSANQYRTRTNALAASWKIRSRLEADGSQLQDIQVSQIEVARKTNRFATASR